MKKRLEWLLVHRKWWLLVMASILLFWAVLWAFVPGWVKQELESQASQALGRKVTVAGVKFLPWTMELEVKGLQIANREGSDWQFRLESVHANLELSSIRHQAPVIDELRIVKPEVRLQHAGKGVYDIDDLLQRFASDPKAAPTETPRFSVYNIAITAGAIDFVDTPVGKTHEVRDLEFGLPFVSSLPSKREIHVAPHLAFKVNGHPVDLQARATPFSASKQGEFHLVAPAVNIQHWLPYWPTQLAYKPTQGQLQADLKLKFVQGGKEKSDQIRLDGKLAMKNAQWVATKGLYKGAGVAYDSLELESQHLGWPLLAASGNEKPTLLLKSDWPRLAQATNDKAAPAAAGSLSVTLYPQPEGGELSLKLQDARLESLRPLVSQYLEPRLAGGVNLTMGGHWQWHKGQAFQLQLKATELVVNDLLLDTRQMRPLASGVKPENANSVSSSLPVGWKRLALTGLELGWPLKAIQIEQVELLEPQMEFSRDALGAGNWERWIKSGDDSAQSKSSGNTPAIKLGKIAVKGGHLVWWDAAAAGPLVAGHETDRSTARIDVAALNLQMQSLELGAGGLLSKQTPFDLQASISQITRQQKPMPGLLKIKGDLSGQRQGSKPVVLQVKAAVDVQRIPLHALEPYLRSRVHMALLQAEASVKGQVLYRQAQDGSEPQEIWLKGDASLDNVRANSLEPREELLSWKSLQWQGLEYHDTQDQPTVVRVGQSTLSDFYARMIVSEAGRLNLQDVFGKKRHVEVAKTAETPPQAAAPASAAAAPAPASTAAVEPPADVYIGPSRLVNGRVNFSDRFIKPNYSAALSELNGELGGFSSQPKDGQIQMANIDLQGKAQGSALLTVSGKLNPLAKPVALDIKANVRDLELPPLSPYAAKYLGYAIDRGKLDVDVKYQVQPDGRLVANNNFILNQLTLGDKVEGQGSSLPVKLAISLLKDRNGVIDVNLPISGSLDDPDFKVGPIVWKLVLNLIGRALTSPFSLIAGAFGGSADQAGQVNFDPGADRLNAASMKQLDQIAKAMKERPVLKVNLAGQSSTSAEKTAYQRYQVQRQVLAEHKRRNPESKVANVLELSPADYEKALKAVYSASGVKKPRNLIGMAKDIPVADMEALLMEAVALNEDTWRQLALARAQQVKDYLTSAGLGLERLFIVPPQLQSQTGVALTLTTD